MSLKICFIAPTAYPLLSGQTDTGVIGPAIHQVLLARELIKNGFQISILTYSKTTPHIEQIDGMEVIKVPLADSAGPVRKALRLWKAMVQAKADIYFHQGGSPGIAALYCRRHHKRFVLGIGSDAHVSKKNSFGLLERLGSRLDIKYADVIIAQTEFQRDMLKRNFGREGRVIRNHFPLAPQNRPEKAQPPVVLWVGSMAKVKQPGLFLQLAQAIPEATFQMIGGYYAGNKQEQATFENIKRDLRDVAHFSVLGYIPFDKVDEYFRRAAILVNTSELEGFPYAFIQAWMHYTPVVSLNADPDEIICQRKLGFHSRSFEQLVKDVTTLLADEPLRQQMGGNARRYVEENHDIKNIVKQYIEVFNGLVKNPE
ncbi:MAG: glycosyltransferase family 4 protein [Dehalococcoidales bacterium]|jgi:glycosyltransferase involved in cell wall biosynthesis